MAPPAKWLVLKFAGVGGKSLATIDLVQQVGAAISELAMENLTHYPLLMFTVSFLALSLVAAAASWLRRRYLDSDDELGVILGAALSLLGLIFGFSFSMAISRYDRGYGALSWRAAWPKSTSSLDCSLNACRAGAECA